MATINVNKRRRTAADTLHISDLPIGFIADVSAYLPKPSRALFAVAFSEPSSSSKNNDYQLSPISIAIVSATQWDILDFGDVEMELANKLTDNDINAVLKSINAQDVLKRLKLAGCVNIEGHGLHPLRRSSTLEQIDLSMAKQHEEPDIDPAPLIRVDVVLPILDSIISLRSNQFSLKHIQIPYKWREDDDNLHLMAEFRARYNTLLSIKYPSCTQCNTSMDNKKWLASNRDLIQKYSTCYICLKHFCGDFDCFDGHETLQHCYSCDKDYCLDCMHTLDCTQCDGWRTCNGCQGSKECDECGTVFCEYCVKTCDECNKDYCEDCVRIFKCSAPSCNRKQCARCWKRGGDYSDIATQKEHNNVIHCFECEKDWCFNCLPVSIKNEDCYGCLCISQGVEGR